MDAAEVRTGPGFFGASIVMAFVASAERTGSIRIAVTSVFLARDVFITVRATCDSQAMAAVSDTGQVLLATTAFDLSVGTALYLTAMPFAECLSRWLDPVTTLLCARLMRPTTTIWFRWVLAALDGTGMGLTEPHVDPPELWTPWHAASKMHSATIVLLCKVDTSVLVTRMGGTEASPSIRLVSTSAYLAVRDVSQTEARGAGFGLDTRDNLASMDLTAPGKCVVDILSGMVAVWNNTSSMLVAVLDVW